MKALIGVLLLLWSFSVQAQVDFAPIGAKWYYDGGRGGSPFVPSPYHLYESVGDTVLGGEPMRVVIGKQWVSATSPLQPIDTVYVSANADTVFYYHKLLQEKVPLLIFNVQAGDTIWYPTPDYMMTYSNFYWQSIVDSVVYVTVNGRSLRRVYTHEPYGGCCTFAGKSYAERIGSFDYFIHLRPTRIPEDSRTLRCYIDSQLAYHVDPAVACDDHPPAQAVSNLWTLPADWQILSNPASGRIRFRGTTSAPFNYRLYTAQGQVQASGQAVPVAGIDVTETPPGWYLLQVQVVDAVYTQRVFIQ